MLSNAARLMDLEPFDESQRARTPAGTVRRAELRAEASASPIADATRILIRARRTTSLGSGQAALRGSTYHRSLIASEIAASVLPCIRDGVVLALEGLY